MQHVVELWEVPLHRPARARADSHAALRTISARRPDARTSLSHTDGLALVALGTCEVGVDVEHVGNAPDPEELEDLALLTLSEREATALARVGAAERPLRWLALWTRKEAVLKAAGSTIGDPAIRDIDAFGAGVLELRPGRDYVGAVAIGDPGSAIVHRRHRRDC
jgi:4'-phosphopantetheinyl transferase